MIEVRIRNGSERLVKAMGIIVTVRRANNREVELGFRYAEGTKPAIPEKMVDKDTPRSIG